jgi:SAM-dependent methyltransferase
LLGAIEVAKARVRLALGVQPLSEIWGIDRGVPICIYYIHDFMREFRSDVRGLCLEFQEDSYTSRYGGSAVSRLDILHVDDSNPVATVIADLTKPNDIPSDRFDCIVCTHVLHVIFDLQSAVEELFRILKPGGSLLAAVPHVSMCGPKAGELWRFTPEGLFATLAQTFDARQVTIRAYGNSLTASGQLRGLVASEFRTSELQFHDPRFAVEVCARATKSSSDNLDRT